jgi:hypothetical protein
MGHVDTVEAPPEVAKAILAKALKHLPNVPRRGGKG